MAWRRQEGQGPSQARLEDLNRELRNDGGRTTSIWLRAREFVAYECRALKNRCRSALNRARVKLLTVFFFVSVSLSFLCFDFFFNDDLLLPMTPLVAAAAAAALLPLLGAATVSVEPAPPWSTTCKVIRHEVAQTKIR